MIHCPSIFLVFAQVLAPTPQDPVISSVHQEPQGHGETVTLRMYEVRELLVGFVESHEGESEGDRAGREAAETMGIAKTRARMEEDTQRANAKALGEMISLFIQPPLGERHIAEVAGNHATLVVRGTEAHHRWVQEFLTMQRQNPRAMIDIQHQFFFLEDEDMKTLDLQPGSWLISRKSNSAEEAKARMAHSRLVSKEVGDLVNAPRILTLNRQRFTISVTNQQSYVKYYKVHERVQPRNIRIVDPVIDVVEEGLIADGRAVLLAEGTIGFLLQVTLSELERPMREEKTELGVIGLPVVKTTGLETQVVLAADDSFFYVGPRNADGKCFGTIVRATVVPMESEGEGRDK